MNGLGWFTSYVLTGLLLFLVAWFSQQAKRQTGLTLAGALVVAVFWPIVPFWVVFQKQPRIEKLIVLGMVFGCAIVATYLVDLALGFMGRSV